MDIKATILTVISLAMASASLSLLWIFFGYWRSGQRTKGAKNRLRFPDPNGVAPICGFKPGQDVIDFYKTSEVVEQHEFQFIDTRSEKPKAWHISHFTPITPVDTQEEIKGTGITHGLPIADSGDGGVYYVTPSGSVHLRDTTNHNEDLLVAESVTAFAHFRPLEETVEYAK